MTRIVRMAQSLSGLVKFGHGSSGTANGIPCYLMGGSEDGFLFFYDVVLWLPIRCLCTPVHMVRETFSPWLQLLTVLFNATTEN